MGLTQKLGTIPLAIQTDSSNNVGIGGAANASYKLTVTGNTLGTGTAFDFFTSSGIGSSGVTGLLRVVTAGTNTGIAIGQANSSRYTAIQPNEHIIYNDDFFMRTNGAFPLSLGTNNTIRLSISATGNVGIGTTSPGAPLDVWRNGTNGLVASFTDGVSSNLQIQTTSTGTLLTPTTNTYLALGTNNTERMRITSSGWFKAANNGVFLNINGNYHELTTSIGDNIFIASNYNSTPYGPYMWFVNASPNNTTQYFLLCDDSVNSKAAIYSNGTFGSRTGTYGSIISDIKYKQDITDASSQWDDIKKLRVVNFKYKEDVELEGENALRQIGFIAQEVEAVSPNLVYESGKKDSDETWKSVKTSIIHLKAVKALQEAMARIEELEAKVTALENK